MQTKFNPEKEMVLRKTSRGNYTCWHNGYYLFFFRRPHGKWCCMIRKNWVLVTSSGYFTTSLPTLADAKKWAKNNTPIWG